MRKQRFIDPEHWQGRGLLRASREARLTGMLLWGIVDDAGRLEVRPELIAGSIYPGEPDMTPSVIEEHLMELEDSGFLLIYQADGLLWMQLLDPLKTPRPKRSEAPPPNVMQLQEGSRGLMAVGGESAGERARARVQSERAEQAERWAEWESEQEQAHGRPARPLLLDAPPIGCPEHPNGRFADCGPCGTARRRHDRWVAQERYADAMSKHEDARGG